VIAFFLPFDPRVVEANSLHRDRVANEWSTAYVETNALIARISAHLSAELAQHGVRSAAAAATHNYDPVTLTCPWSHKSVAVIAGLGSFGLHQMVITDAGCAGRFGSLVVDVDLRATAAAVRERCLYFHDGSCTECIDRCPANALSKGDSMDKQRCHRRLLEIAAQHGAKACGKCAVVRCALQSAV
jgi:epoxyqueuosine reductase QueG